MSICLTVSEIDWSMTKDVFSIIGTVGALLVASLGLSTWRRQLSGTSEYEVAKKAMLATYEVQQAIQAVRNPMLHLSKDEVEKGRRLEEEQRIYDERMKYLFENWAELQTIRLEAKVIWSTEAHDCFNGIQSLIGEMKGEIWLHFWMKGAYAAGGATVDNSAERVAKNDKIIYFAGEDDEFSRRITKAVEEVEHYFRRKLRG